MLSELEEALLNHTEKLAKVAERLLRQARADGEILRDLHELLERVTADPAFRKADHHLQQVTRAARDGLATYLGDSAQSRSDHIVEAPPAKRYTV